MTEYTHSTTEDVHELLQDSHLDADALPNLASDRREHIQVVHNGNGELHERVVEDLAVERQAILAKVTGLALLMAGLLEAAIALRVILKLIAANPASPFATLVYGFTDLFLWPFHNLVVNPTAANGMVLEFTSLIAMVIYGLLAWVTIYLLNIIFSPATSRRLSVYRRDEI